MNATVDWEELDAPEDAALQTKKLGRLAELCNDLLRYERDIEQRKEELKEIEKKARSISDGTIPELLGDLGLEEIKLDDGTKVRVKEDVRVSTTGKYRLPIFNWLKKIGEDKMIRNELVVPLGKDAFDRLKSLTAFLRDNGFQFDQQESVNAGSFAALLRGRRERGEDVPYDELGAFLQKRAKLTVPKK